MKQTLFVCIVVIAFGAGTACIATKETYVSRGNKLYDAGKYSEASLNYLKAIQKDPKFGEAYYRLGLAAIKQDQGREAYDALRRAVQLLPTSIEAREKLADVSLVFYLANPQHPMWLYRQLTQLSAELLEKNPNSYKGLMLSGYLATSDRKEKEAITFFRRALQIDSSNPGVVTELVRLLIADRQGPEAEKRAKDLIASQKTYGPIYNLLSDYYSSSGREKDAENVLKTKVQNNPKEAAYVLQLAGYYFRHQKPAEMNAALQQLLSNPKDFPQAQLSVGDFQLGLKNYPEALKQFEAGVAAAREPKDKLVYQKRLAVTLLADGQMPAALSLISKVVQQNPTDEEALRLHADLLLDTAKIENADIAIRELKTLTKIHPQDAGLHFRLGRAFRLKGDVQAARDQFQAAVNKGGNLLGPRYELAEVSLDLLNTEEALRQANEILRLSPNDPRGTLLHARASMETHAWAVARAELTSLAKNSSQSAEAQLQLGLLSLVEGKYRDANDILVKHAKDDPRAVAGLSSVYLYQGQTAKARSVLDEGLRKWPNARVLREQLGNTEAVAGNYDAAISQYNQMLLKDPKSVMLLQRLGALYEHKGDHNKAVETYQQAYALSPNDSNMALLLADGLARAGRTAEAKRQYEGLMKAHPDDLSATNNLAYLLADTGGDLDEALRLAQSALAKAPKEAAYADTVGYIYLKKGMRDSATRTFSSLVHLYPHFPPFRYHLGMALLESGNKTAAKKELQAALADRPSGSDKEKITELLHKIG
jgi:tetratricopeptide (TPR) repeat protein